MIIYGKQIVLFVLEHHSNLIEEVLLAKEIDSKLFSRFAKLNKAIIKLDNKKAQALSRGGNHQGFFLKIKEFNFTPLSELKKSKFLVILDSLTDMGNIGAIIRSSYALGADGIVITGIKDIKMEQIIRTSSASALDMPISSHFDISDLLNQLKLDSFSLVGAHMNGEDIKEFKQDLNKIALIVGNEGSGLQNKVLKKLDYQVSIKMAREFDSLNVSVASAILIHHLKG
ncbi:MAG: 23S rRNA (guanosine(2251)-2'-O)-methyltransferase RlmB [Arcobacter butzleri]|jgi:23S rRNA (guanosine2251-2'-O)-methyltransferase|nr:23S rRNA (guanosine(2251)-2'-O)-methyltransferase RlmB [Arcobacteraceae bacterium]MDY0364590.1 23S rRNA (guanosine(2251)-2'-O)-methyltransferase RlmB [Arcobacteraceae bacterium]NLO17403.1 23S rRNA (guanosine(2251)-2'-O)-methyltransferase RlmB [Aliarcobacter butzleri]